MPFLTDRHRQLVCTDWVEQGMWVCSSTCLSFLYADQSFAGNYVPGEGSATTIKAGALTAGMAGVMMVSTATRCWGDARHARVHIDGRHSQFQTTRSKRTIIIQYPESQLI